MTQFCDLLFFGLILSFHPIPRPIVLLWRHNNNDNFWCDFSGKKAATKLLNFQQEDRIRPYCWKFNKWTNKHQLNNKQTNKPTLPHTTATTIQTFFGTSLHSTTKHTTALPNNQHQLPNNYVLKICHSTLPTIQQLSNNNPTTIRQQSNNNQTTSMWREHYQQTSINKQYNITNYPTYPTSNTPIQLSNNSTTIHQLNSN